MNTVYGDFAQANEVDETYVGKTPVMLRFAPNWPLRELLFRGTGIALILGAAALWMFPGVAADLQMVIFKFGISVVFFFGGLGLFLQNHAENRPDAYFDPIRQEVRVVQKNRRGRPQVVLRRAYSSLGKAAFSRDAMELFDTDGSLLMRLRLDDADVRYSLLSQLDGRVRLAA